MDKIFTDSVAEEGDYYEGDMILKRGSLKVTAPNYYRWPNGIVPYEIEGTFSKQVCTLFSDIFGTNWFSPIKPQVTW